MGSVAKDLIVSAICSAIIVVIGVGVACFVAWSLPGWGVIRIAVFIWVAFTIWAVDKDLWFK